MNDTDGRDGLQALQHLSDAHRGVQPSAEVDGVGQLAVVADADAVGRLYLLQHAGQRRAVDGEEVVLPEGEGLCVTLLADGVAGRGLVVDEGLAGTEHRRAATVILHGHSTFEEGDGLLRTALVGSNQEFRAEDADTKVTGHGDEGVLLLMMHGEIGLTLQRHLTDVCLPDVERHDKGAMLAQRDVAAIGQDHLQTGMGGNGEGHQAVGIAGIDRHNGAIVADRQLPCGNIQADDTLRRHLNGAFGGVHRGDAHLPRADLGKHLLEVCATAMVEEVEWCEDEQHKNHGGDRPQQLATVRVAVRLAGDGGPHVGALIIGEARLTGGETAHEMV